jgi:hypothetical protein
VDSGGRSILGIVVLGVASGAIERVGIDIPDALGNPWIDVRAEIQ